MIQSRGHADKARIAIQNALTDLRKAAEYCKETGVEYTLYGKLASSELVAILDPETIFLAWMDE